MNRTCCILLFMAAPSVCCQGKPFTSDTDNENAPDSDSTSEGLFGTGADGTMETDSETLSSQHSSGLCNVERVWTLPYPESDAFSNAYHIQGTTDVLAFSPSGIRRIDLNGEVTRVFNREEHADYYSTIAPSGTEWWISPYWSEEKDDESEILFYDSNGRVTDTFFYDHAVSEFNSGSFSPIPSTPYIILKVEYQRGLSLVTEGFHLFNRQGQKLRSLPTEGQPTFSNYLYFSGNGDALYVTSSGEGFYSIRLEDGASWWHYDFPSIGYIIVSYDGRRIFVKSAYELFMLDNGTLLGDMFYESGSIRSTVLDPTGTYAAYATLDLSTTEHEAKVVVIENGRQRHAFTTKQRYVNGLDISPAGDQLVAGSSDGDGGDGVYLVDKNGTLLSYLALPEDDNGWHPNVKFMGDGEQFTVIGRDELTLYRIVGRDSTCEPQILTFF